MTVKVIKSSPVFCGKKGVGGDEITEFLLHGDPLRFCVKHGLILCIPVKDPEGMGFCPIAPLFQGGKGAGFQSDFRNGTAACYMKITLF